MSDRTEVWTLRYKACEDDLDAVYRAVTENDSASDQLAAVYEVLERTGRKVP